MQNKLKKCSRGHRFPKSPEYPVCPICWPGYYGQNTSEFPKMSRPAIRALANAKITELADLEKYTEKEVSELHGMGPKALGELKQAMRKRKLSFKN